MKVETSFYLIWSFFLFIFACLQFFQGFFPITFVPTLGSDSQKIGADLLEPENNIKSANNGNYYNRSILMIIDALRYDFVEKMPFTWSLLQVDDQAKACMVKLKVHPPTVTMPKIKTIISGTVPSFFDVILNLNSVTRLKANNKKIVFYGDNVWTKLFPGNDFFMRKGENFDSFFVNDFYEGDKNITNAIKSELLQADWDFMILHFLGLDHIGHVLGAQNPTIDEKLLEMDEIIKEIYLKFISNQQNLIFITGDHGMRDAGGHGGSSQDETQVPLIVLGIHCEINEDFYDQTDLATTASILLGLKVPETSNGALIPELLNDFSDNEKLFALNYTSNKLIEKIESQFGVETMKEKEFYLQLTEAHSYHQKYLDLRDPSSFMHSILKYTTSSQEMRSLLTANTVKYDMTSISISTLLAFSIWFKVLIVILNEKEFIEMNFNGKRFGVSLFISIIILKLVVFDVSSVTWSHFFCLLVSIWIITLNVWYLVNEFNLQRISKIFHEISTLPSTLTLLILLTTFHAFSLASSSFVEEEHQTWYYFFNTFTIILCIQHMKHVFRTQLKPKWSRKIVTWILFFVAHILTRRLNQTGDKWINVPDFGDSLMKEEHKMYLSLFTIFGIVTVFYSLEIDKFRSKLVKGLTIVSLMSIYGYRCTAGSVSSLNFISRSYSNMILMVFWASICLLILMLIIFSSSGHKRSRKQLFFILIVVLIASLLQKPHNIILNGLCIITCNFINTHIEAFNSTNPKENDATHIVMKILAHFCIGKVFYFYQGNSNSLATIDLNAGYVGLQEFSFVIVGILLTMNTFNGQILSYLNLVINLNTEVKRKNNENSCDMLIKMYTVLTMTPICIYLIVMILFRYHLFIWTVFSPKLFYKFYIMLLNFLLTSSAFLLNKL
uniref:CSON006523 protein n=1 Tax=Culicoides sonorensis TaxID=179676 RepID=A0A336LZZ4_CULSO